MKKFALCGLLFYVLLFTLTWPVAAMAESPPGADIKKETTAAAESRQGGAAETDYNNYTPPEQAADDNNMAIVVSTIFALPIAGWLIVRSVKKAKK